jgi:hypothetical protein
MRSLGRSRDERQKARQRKKSHFQTVSRSIYSLVAIISGQKHKQLYLYMFKSIKMIDGSKADQHFWNSSADEFLRRALTPTSVCSSHTVFFAVLNHNEDDVNRMNRSVYCHYVILQFLLKYHLRS